MILQFITNGYFYTSNNLIYQKLSSICESVPVYYLKYTNISIQSFLKD